MTHLGPVVHRPDPRRPYKAYAGIAAAMIASLLTQAIITHNLWVVAILSSLAAGLAVYIQGNPPE